MSDEPRKDAEKELEPDAVEQEGKELPDREVMSIIDVGDGGLAPPEFGPPELSDPEQ
jgi:hypothetical protein